MLAQAERDADVAEAPSAQDLIAAGIVMATTGFVAKGEGGKNRRIPIDTYGVPKCPVIGNPGEIIVLFELEPGDNFVGAAPIMNLTPAV